MEQKEKRRGLKVLVIEDNPEILEILITILTQHGKHTVAGVLTGQEGIKKFEAERPDLILVNQGMPGMSGLEVLRYIASSSNPPNVWLTSGLVTSELELEAIRLGAQKAVNTFFLAEVLREEGYIDKAVII